MSPPLLLLAAAVLSQAGNRLWTVELELRGPASEVRLDCGSDGTTRLLGPFLGGEDRRLTVPVPVRSPLGGEALLRLPLPRAELVPAEGGGAVRVVGWSPEQPTEDLLRRAGALLARARPPGERASVRAGPAEALALLLAGGLLLGLRRRPGVSLLVALLAAGLVFTRLRTRPVPPAPTHEVLECEAGRTQAVLLRSAWDELPLTGERLEVVPEDESLEFVLRGDGAEVGLARARGARLTSAASRAAPALEPARNRWEALTGAWTRDTRGVWRERGPWASGEALPPGREGSSPPGWLASALPPGRGVLIGRTASGTWLRSLGFEGGDRD